MTFDVSHCLLIGQAFARCSAHLFEAEVELEDDATVLSPAVLASDAHRIVREALDASPPIWGLDRILIEPREHRVLNVLTVRVGLDFLLVLAARLSEVRPNLVRFDRADIGRQHIEPSDTELVFGQLLLSQALDVDVELAVDFCPVLVAEVVEADSDGVDEDD